MKIAEVARSYLPSYGGLEKFVHSRVKLFLKLEHKVNVITTDYTTKQNNTKVEYETDVITLRQYTIYNICPKILSLLFKKYDILSVNQIGNFLSDFVILFMKGNIVLTPHYIFHTKKYGLIKNLHKKMLLPKLLKKCKKIICFTEFEKNYWIKHYSISRDKIVVIPHYFHTLNDLVDTSDDEYFFYLGRNSSNKEIDISIKAFDRVFNGKMRYYLTINLDDISKESKEIVKSNKNIILLGTISEAKKEEFLKNMSALIFPTNFEAFGIVSFEASKYKKPLLCSKLEIFGEILNPKGVIYFENSVTKIEYAFRKFASLSKNDRFEMGYYNYNNLSRYTFKEVLNKYQTLLSEIDS